MLLMSDCHNVRLPSRHVSRISAVSSWLVKDVHRYVPTVYVCFQLCCFAIKTHGLHRMALARLSSQNLSSLCVCVFRPTLYDQGCFRHWAEDRPYFEISLMGMPYSLWMPGKSILTGESLYAQAREEAAEEGTRTRPLHAGGTPNFA